MKQPKTSIGHIFSYIWNFWIKPPKAKIPKTVLDIQRDASSIGGTQFKQIQGVSQVFFWMPERNSGPKLGEYVYMSYEPDKTGKIERIISHIHYPLSKNEDGSVEVKKYFASNDTGASANYAHRSLDDSELYDLLTAAKQFRQKIADKWGYSANQQ